MTKWNTYLKWLASSKFQIAVMCMAFVFLQQEFYSLNPEVATDAFLKVTLGYFGARVLEPVVEFLINKKNNNHEAK